MRKIVSSVDCALPLAEDDIRSMEAQIVKLVAELILLKNRLRIDAETGEAIMLPTTVLHVPELTDWLVAIGCTEKLVHTLHDESVENFLLDMADVKVSVHFIFSFFTFFQKFSFFF